MVCATWLKSSLGDEDAQDGEADAKSASPAAPAGEALSSSGCWCSGLWVFIGGTLSVHPMLAKTGKKKIKAEPRSAMEHAQGNRFGQSLALPPVRRLVTRTPVPSSFSLGEVAIPRHIWVQMLTAISGLKGRAQVPRTHYHDHAASIGCQHLARSSG